MGAGGDEMKRPYKHWRHGLKQCSQCKLFYEPCAENFDTTDKTRCGLVARCRKCRRESQRADYQTWGHRSFPEVQAWLYTVAYLRHGDERLLDKAMECRNLDRHEWDTTEDGSGFVHWLLSPDCGRLCAAKYFPQLRGEL